uniref:Major facilitator superfamily (MFS) profile domain-containing protein n=1 Tax=Ditylenchus dipsaci TaxID=166011 RepID=A0A915DQ26_9BILA
MLDHLVQTYCKWLPFKGSVRYWILLISIVTMTFIYANIMAFNFTIICMLEPEEEDQGLERNGLFSSTAIGALASSVVFAYCTDKFGTRDAFVGFGIVSALSTLLIPLSAQLGYASLFIIRILQGTGLPAILTMVSSVSKEWSPTITMGSYILLLSTHIRSALHIIHLESFVSLDGAALCVLLARNDHSGFNHTLYSFFRDAPDSPHPCRSGQEDTLQKIFKDPVVWISLMAFFGDELGYVLFLEYGPIFLNKVLGMDVRETGFAAALPFIVSLMMKLVVGQ